MPSLGAELGVGVGVARVRGDAPARFEAVGGGLALGAVDVPPPVLGVAAGVGVCDGVGVCVGRGLGFGVGVGGVPHTSVSV